MKTITAVIIMISVLSAGCLTKAGPVMIDTPVQDVKIIVDPAPVINTPIPTPTETPYPQPSDIPEMRPYQTMEKEGIILPFDPASYLTPDNEWVKWQASQLYLSDDGTIRYKDQKVEWAVKPDGTVLLWADKPFVNTYSFSVYGANVNKNNVPWLMPDFYLTHGITGVCSAWAVTVYSLLQSGEMSIIDNGQYIKNKIPAKVVIGFRSSYRDAWVEYKAYGKTFITSTSLIKSGFSGTDLISSTQFDEKYKIKNKREIFEFTDKYFGAYHET